ncbi:MAG: hypothetical protein PHX18_03785 [Candidatus Gastranaerophilales bacterium]|nr:hypothetical protein [Candidatus Gastranaerophilales bacterium]
MKIRHSMLTGIILASVGGYKIYSDYKESSPENKKKTLIKNVSVIGACALGVFGMDKFVSRNLNNKQIQSCFEFILKPLEKTGFIKNFIGKFTKKKPTDILKIPAVSEITADCTKNLILTLTGLISGLGGGLLVDKFINKEKSPYLKHPPQKPSIETEEPFVVIEDLTPASRNKKIQQIIFNDKSRNLISNTSKVFGTAGFFINPLDKPFIVLDGLSVANEKSVDKIIEQTTQGIIAETLVPTLFMSLTNSVLKSKQWFIRLPAIGGALVLGSFTGNKAGALFNKKITEEIFKYFK